MPAVIFDNTYTWGGSGGSATVRVVVDDDAPGFAGQYDWTYTVTNTGFGAGVIGPPGSGGADQGISVFAASVGDPNDVSAVSSSLGWSASIGPLQNGTAQVTWQGGARIGLNQSADFRFATSVTAVLMIPASNYATNAPFTGTAAGPLAVPAPALLVTEPTDPVVVAGNYIPSLRGAINEVNSQKNMAGIWKVRFGENLRGQTLTLDPQQGQIELQKPISLDGQDKNITVQRDSASTVQHRIFWVKPSGDAELTGLTLKNGLVTTFGLAGTDGGAIKANSRLRVVNCTFVNNQAGVGGAIAFHPGGTGYRGLSIVGSVFTGSTASSGGALYIDSGALASISSTSFVLNIASDSGGGIFIYPGDAASPTLVTLTGVDVSGNSAVSKGGGIYVPTNGSNLTLTLTGGTTISNNQATSTTGKGGGIYFGKGTLNLNGVSFANNIAFQGDGLYILLYGTTMQTGAGGVTYTNNGVYVGTG